MSHWRSIVMGCGGQRFYPCYRFSYKAPSQLPLTGLSFTIDVLLIQGKGSSHLISFCFLNALIGFIVPLAEYIPVFILSGLSVSILKMEREYSPHLWKWSWNAGRLISWSQRELNPITMFPIFSGACSASQWWLSNMQDVCSRQIPACFLQEHELKIT